MPGLENCPVCGRSCGPQSNNPSPHGLWCKSCEGNLIAAGGGLKPRAQDHQISHALSRDILAGNIYSAKGPLETLNMCIKWLDRKSPGSYGHPNFHPTAALDDSRYKKEDFDPDASPPFDIEGHRHSQQLYLAALAAFRIYDRSQFALSWLRRAYQVDKKVFLFLLGDESKGVNHWAADFHTNMYKPTWAQTPGALDWVRASIEDVELKPCDGIGCRKAEERPRVFKCCARCKVMFYCGVECQKSDWAEGHHKTSCAGWRDFARKK